MAAPAKDVNVTIGDKTFLVLAGSKVKDAADAAGVAIPSV